MHSKFVIGAFTAAGQLYNQVRVHALCGADTIATLTRSERPGFFTCIHNPPTWITGKIDTAPTTEPDIQREIDDEVGRQFIDASSPPPPPPPPPPPTETYKQPTKTTDGEDLSHDNGDPTTQTIPSLTHWLFDLYEMDESRTLLMPLCFLALWAYIIADIAILPILIGFIRIPAFNLWILRFILQILRFGQQTVRMSLGVSDAIDRYVSSACERVQTSIIRLAAITFLKFELCELIGFCFTVNIYDMLVYSSRLLVRTIARFSSTLEHATALTPSRFWSVGNAFGNIFLSWPFLVACTVIFSIRLYLGRCSSPKTSLDRSMLVGQFSEQLRQCQDWIKTTVQHNSVRRRRSLVENAEQETTALLQGMSRMRRKILSQRVCIRFMENRMRAQSKHGKEDTVYYSGDIKKILEDVKVMIKSQEETINSAQTSTTALFEETIKKLTTEHDRSIKDLGEKNESLTQELELLKNEAEKEKLAHEKKREKYYVYVKDLQCQVQAAKDNLAWQQQKIDALEVSNKTLRKTKETLQNKIRSVIMEENYDDFTIQEQRRQLISQNEHQTKMQETIDALVKVVEKRIGVSLDIHHQFPSVTDSIGARILPHQEEWDATIEALERRRKAVRALGALSTDSKGKGHGTSNEPETDKPTEKTNKSHSKDVNSDDEAPVPEPFFLTWSEGESEKEDSEKKESENEESEKEESEKDKRGKESDKNKTEKEESEREESDKEESEKGESEKEEIKKRAPSPFDWSEEPLWDPEN